MWGVAKDYSFWKHKKGFYCEGLEPSKNHSPRKESNIKVFRGFLKDFNLNKKYDIITLLDVLEHTKDPLGELNQIRRIIKKEGIIMIRVPNLRWLVIKEHAFNLIKRITNKDISKLNPKGVYSPYTHLYNFSEKSIKKLLDLSGFKILKIEIINASKTYNLFKNLFYSVYYKIIKMIYLLFRINLAISLNIIAAPNWSKNRK